MDIHTLTFLCRPAFDDVDVCRQWPKAREGKTPIHLFGYKDLHFKYLEYDYRTNQPLNMLFITTNPRKVLNKEITINDYELFRNSFLSQFYDIFSFTNQFELNRIDYKLDIQVQEKEKYMKLLQKTGKYKRLKAYKEYETSIYQNGKSYRINIYDKEQEKKAKNEPIDKYQDVVRFEVQILNRKLNYNLKTEGQLKDLMNYWNEYEYKRAMQMIEDVVYTGDYYNIKKAKEKIEMAYSATKAKKLTKFLKEIEKKGITRVRKELNNQTFRNYIQLLDVIGINPITIPSKWDIQYMKNYFIWELKNKLQEVA